MESKTKEFTTDEIKEMSVIERLARCRVELQNRPLQKSGYNNYLGYSYFELKDFVPALNEIFLKYRLLPRFSFDEPTTATLTIFGFDKEDEPISFSMVKGEEKGKDSITDVASANTYLKRYLLINSLFLCENDVVDKNFKKEDTKKYESKPVKHYVQKQAEATLGYASDQEKKVANDKIRNYIKENKNNTSKIGVVMKGHNFSSLNELLKGHVTSEELANIMVEIKSICEVKEKEAVQENKQKQADQHEEIEQVVGEVVLDDYMEDDVDIGF